MLRRSRVLQRYGPRFSRKDHGSSYLLLACDPAFGTEVPFHSLSSVRTLRTRGAPAEIQMTMIPSGPGYRIRALSASAIVGGNDECLFSEEGESRQFRDSHAKKKGRRRRNVFIRAIRCNPQVVATAGRSPSLAAPSSNFLLAAHDPVDFSVLNLLIPKSFLNNNSEKAPLTFVILSFKNAIEYPTHFPINRNCDFM